MKTTVTGKNMVSIPAEVARQFGIKPGYKLDWEPVEGKQEILIKVIPDRVEIARQLFGKFAHYSPGVDAVAELIREREEELALENEEDEQIRQRLASHRNKL